MNKYTIIYPHSYIKRAAKFFKRHPDLIQLYRKTLELLEINPHHSSLRLHPLKAKFLQPKSLLIHIIGQFSKQEFFPFFSM